jgi:transglutaminase-like putative cysteine protease
VKDKDLQKFLTATEYVDFGASVIAERGKELFAGINDDILKAKVAYEFVRDEIPHSFDIGATTITAKASEVLRYRTGICHAKANLLAALLRSQRIPSGFCYQHITLADDDSQGYCLHCFNAVCLNEHWVFLDARGNTNGKNAEFSLAEPILAFPCRTQYDEYIFGGVWAEPDAPTMKLLANVKTLREVADGLPEKPYGKPDIYPLSQSGLSYLGGFIE